MKKIKSFKFTTLGFTLIELLAVIVILAIIALIAIPIVLNIVNETKESSILRSAEFYLSAVEIAVANESLYEGGLNPGQYSITPSGDICTKSLPCDEEHTLKVKVDGEKPTSGNIRLTKEGKVLMAIKTGNFCIIKDKENEGVSLNSNLEKCELPPLVYTLSDLATTGTFSRVDGSAQTQITSVHDCATNKTAGACQPGTEFAIKVNDKKTYRFFVIEDTGTKVTLIMDRNLYAEGNTTNPNVAWVNSDDFNIAYGTYGTSYASTNSFNTKGPVTALNELQLRTSDWTNLQMLTIDSKDSPNLSDTYTMYARLLKNSEFSALYNNLGYGVSILPSLNYLYENIGDYGDSNTSGYWTMTLDSSTYDKARTICLPSYSIGDFVYNANSYGLRPVIEITK